MSKRARASSFAALLALAACAPRYESDAAETSAVIDGGAVLSLPHDDDSGVVDLVSRVPSMTLTVVNPGHWYSTAGSASAPEPDQGRLFRYQSATAEESWFVDDSCDLGACSPDANRRLDYFKRANNVWTRVDSLTLPPGAKQRTATVFAGDTLSTYVLTSTDGYLWECVRYLLTGDRSCSRVPGLPGRSASDVGAALSPRGDRVVWFTNASAGAGTFSYLVRSSTGWSAIRTTRVGTYPLSATTNAGYNGAFDVRVDFGVDHDLNKLIFHGRLTGGALAGAISRAGLAELDLAAPGATAWKTELVAPPDSTVLSTSDVFVDRESGDVHLLARTAISVAYYYRRANTFVWSNPLRETVGATLARWIPLAGGELALVSVIRGKEVQIETLPRGARVAGQPLAFATASRRSAALPASEGDITALYTESSPSQNALPTGVELAIVTSARPDAVAHVAMP